MLDSSVFYHLASRSYLRLNEKGPEERNQILRAIIIEKMQSYASEVG